MHSLGSSPLGGPSTQEVSFPSVRVCLVLLEAPATDLARKHNRVMPRPHTMQIPGRSNYRVTQPQASRALVGRTSSALSVAEIITSEGCGQVLHITSQEGRDRNRPALARGQAAPALGAAPPSRAWLAPEDLNGYCGDTNGIAGLFRPRFARQSPSSREGLLPEATLPPGNKN